MPWLQLKAHVAPEQADLLEELLQRGAVAHRADNSWRLHLRAGIQAVQVAQVVAKVARAVDNTILRNRDK